MNDISFLMAGAFHCRYLPTILEENNLKYRVYGTTTGILSDEEALLRARNMVDDGTKVIITAGRFANLFIQNLQIPVITMRYNSIGFAKAVKTARSISKNVACMVRYGGIYDAAIQYKTTFKDKIIIEGYDNEHDSLKSLEFLKTKHIEVIICGSRGPILAKKYGYHFEFITVTFEESEVLHAVDEAEHILSYIRLNAERLAYVYAIQNQFQQAILAFDLDLRITEINQSCLDLFQLNRRDVDSCFLKDTPFLPLINLIGIHGEQASGKRLLSINNRWFWVAISTVDVKNQQETMVAVIESVANLQEQSRKIRAALYMHNENVSHVPLDSKNINYRHMLNLAHKYAGSNAPILIEGPVGCGKETIARIIHDTSDCREGPFVSVNCASLCGKGGEQFLLGADNQFFTRSDAVFYGQFEMAQGGTILLHGISELPLPLQSKLLDEIKQYRILNTIKNSSTTFQVRVIATTETNLGQQVSNHKFRQDLYYSLAVLRLTVPPLDEHSEDIPELISYLLQEKSHQRSLDTPEIHPEAIKFLSAQHYSGNIQQLTNIAERLLVLGDGKAVTMELAETAFSSTISPMLNAMDEIPSTLDPQLIRETLMCYHGNRTLTAKQLKISPTTLWRRMKQYNID